MTTMNSDSLLTQNLLILNRSLLPLTGKLNKYLINIIDQYNFIDIKNLIKDVSDKDMTPHLNKNLTIEDIIIKSIQLGYKGFLVSDLFETICEELDNLLINSKLIDKEINSNHYFYYFEGDKRNMFCIDIMRLENVVI